MTSRRCTCRARSTSTQLGFYDGLIFHRVSPRASWPGRRPDGRSGTGGPGYSARASSRSRRSTTKPGILSMANAGPGTDGQPVLPHLRADAAPERSPHRLRQRGSGRGRGRREEARGVRLAVRQDEAKSSKIVKATIPGTIAETGNPTVGRHAGKSTMRQRSSSVTLCAPPRAISTSLRQSGGAWHGPRRPAARSRRRRSRSGPSSLTPGLRFAVRSGWNASVLAARERLTISFEMRMLHQSWPHIAQKSVSTSRSSSWSARAVSPSNASSNWRGQLSAARARDEVVVPLARARDAARDVAGVGGDLVGDAALLHVVAPSAGRRAPSASRSRASRAPWRAASVAPIALGDDGRSPGRRRSRAGRARRRARRRRARCSRRMFQPIWSSGTWPGPSTIACTPRARARCTSSPSVRSSASCAGVARVGEAARPEAVAERVGDVVLAHDRADLVEELEHRVLLAVVDHPLREQRAAARDDAGDARADQREVLAQHARRGS